jgi:hypothetical protein
MHRLDYTNKNLTKSNQKSLDTYNVFGIKDYQSYINTLHTMKVDLEFIFKRIRILKNKLQLKYPAEFAKGKCNYSFN